MEEEYKGFHSCTRIDVKRLWWTSPFKEELTDEEVKTLSEAVHNLNSTSKGGVAIYAPNDLSHFTWHERKRRASSYMQIAYQVTCAVIRRILKKKRQSHAHRPLRFWELFSLILPRKTRSEVFEPFYNEFKEDYVFARRRYRTKWARRWLNVCFTLRTVCMVIGCLRVLLGTKIWKLLLVLLPESVRKLFTWLTR